MLTFLPLPRRRRRLPPVLPRGGVGYATPRCDGAVDGRAAAANDVVELVVGVLGVYPITPTSGLSRKRTTSM